MTFDLAVIGGGVVGCALFRRFALGGLKTILLERAPDILAGASKANSAMLHTGFDAPTGSLEQACIQAGHAEYLAIRDPLNLPLLESGGLMVAWTEEELARLPAVVAQAHANGVSDVRQIDAAEARRREPHLAPDVLGGVIVPREHLIDPWSAPLAYVLQAMALGGEVRRGCAVTGGDFDGKAWRLATTTGPVEARIVVNAAGLQGDVVEAIARPSPFVIKPRKGQFVVFDKPAARLITACIMPVPSERTKGVMVARTIFGNLLVGPTAEEQEDREHAAVDHAALEALIARGQRILPGLASETVTALYAGTSAGHPVQGLPDRGPARIATGSPRRASAPPASPARWASRFTRRRSIAGISASFASSLRPSIRRAQSRRASAAPPCCARLWRDGLPLRAGDAGRDRGCAGRAAAGRAISAG